MASLVHLFIKLVYIAILSALYTSIIFAFILLLQKILLKKPLLHVKTKIFNIACITSASIIYVSLFLYMISHWGDGGLADYARLPLEHNKKVVQIDGNSTYIENGELGQIRISDFSYDDDRLYAKIDDEYKEGEFLVWDLDKATWEIFLTKEEYLEKGYPAEDTFKSFRQHHHDRWSGWRYWLLP